MTTDERNLRAGALLLIAMGLGVLVLLLGAILVALLGLELPTLGLELPTFDSHVVLLTVALAMALVGLVWLLLLRSGDASWVRALQEHQIQGFNGVLLVGIGLQMAVKAEMEIVHAETPMQQAMTVLGSVIAWVPLWAFMWKIRPLEDGSARRH